VGVADRREIGHGLVEEIRKRKQSFLIPPSP
jgi:hypothetical protein